MVFGCMHHLHSLVNLILRDKGRQSILRVQGQATKKTGTALHLRSAYIPRICSFVSHILKIFSHISNYITHAHESHTALVPTMFHT